MIRTNYEKQAVIQRLLNQKKETEEESFIQEAKMKSKWVSKLPSRISKETDYDIPAEVILSQTAKAKKKNGSRISDNAPR